MLKVKNWWRFLDFLYASKLRVFTTYVLLALLRVLAANLIFCVLLLQFVLDGNLNRKFDSI